MVTQIISTSRWKNMVSSSEKHFKANNWQINHVFSPQIDIVVGKTIFKFALKCVDAENLKFKSPEMIVEEISRDTSASKIPLVTVLDFHVPGKSYETLVDKRCIIFSLDELAQVSGLENYENAPLEELQRRQFALLCKNMWACMKLSQNFERAGKNELAVQWMRRAVASRAGYSIAQLKLFELLLRVKDYEQAEQVGEEAFLQRPDEFEFARGLEHIAILQNRPEKAAKWKARSVADTVGKGESSTFSGLMKRQQKTLTSPSLPQPDPEKTPRNMRSRLRAFFKNDS